MTKNDLKDVSYVGDGVYIGNDGFQVWLFLSNGIYEESFIALEPEAVGNINRYLEKMLNKGKQNGGSSHSL